MLFDFSACFCLFVAPSVHVERRTYSWWHVEALYATNQPTMALLSVVLLLLSKTAVATFKTTFVDPHGGSVATTAISPASVRRSLQVQQPR